MSKLLGCTVLDAWYAVVCCMCHRVLELKGTEDQHMKMETSHTYCKACQIKVMQEIACASTM